MAELDRYVLELRSPLHLAGRGVGIEATDLTVRSDTLFSAICVGLAATRGSSTVDELIEWFAVGLPPFVLGSTFPWAGELFCFPRPRLVPLGSPNATARRARWVSTAVLERLLVDADLTGQDDDQHFFEVEGVWVGDADREAVIPSCPWWQTDDVPRVTVDRESQESQIYRCGRTWFHPEAGLFFLVNWRERAWEAAFDDALAYLADAGLGGERSAGHGQFRVRTHDRVQLAEPTDARFRLTLGLYHPTPSEVAAGVLTDAAYDLELRRGWLSGPGPASLWRRSIRMLAEGAIIQSASDAPGDLVDVTPDGFTSHRVYRAGIALTLGFAGWLPGAERRPAPRPSEGSS